MRALILLTLVACGGSQSTDRTEPAALEPVPAYVEPARSEIEVDARAEREKNLLRVDVAGLARRAYAGADMEEPARWVVEATLGGEPLRRLVIGPANVRREPLHESHVWDVTVRFAVYFDAPPEPVEVAVRVIPPGGEETVIKEKIAASQLPPEPPAVAEPPAKPSKKSKKKPRRRKE